MIACACNHHRQKLVKLLLWGILGILGDFDGKVIRVSSAPWWPSLLRSKLWNILKPSSANTGGVPPERPVPARAPATKLSWSYSAWQGFEGMLRLLRLLQWNRKPSVASPHQIQPITTGITWLFLVMAGWLPVSTGQMTPSYSCSRDNIRHDAIGVEWLSDRMELSKLIELTCADIEKKHART